MFSIADFVIVNADIDLDVTADPIDPSIDYLFSIEEGQTYSLSQIATDYGATSLALLCVTDPEPFYPYPNPDEADQWFVGSVGLRDNNYQTHIGTTGTNPQGKDFNSEGSPPYTLADDNNGDYDPTDFTLGEAWSITCQAFCQGQIVGEVAQDNASLQVTRNFTMVA
jgi:hypothetical protein